MTSPNPCTALQRNWVAQIAIKGQSLSQPGTGAFFGQQGMPSGIAMVSSPTTAKLPFGDAFAGPAIGETARPIIASMVSNRPIMDRLLIPQTYHPRPASYS